MKRQKKTQSESGPKVPGYIVTFSDMVTLLLTFFVMLLSLATTQDPELFNTGRDSFIKALRGYGLGMLWGKQQTLEYGSIQNKYLLPEPEQTETRRTIDAEQEQIRRAFEQLAQSMKTMPPSLKGRRIDIPIVDITFEPGSDTLTTTAIASLQKLILTLTQHPDIENVKLYILGLGDSTRKTRENWLLSTRRADTVARFITSSLPNTKKIPIYSWGAGPGSGWIKRDSSIETSSQIRIVALR